MDIHEETHITLLQKVGSIALCFYATKQNGKLFLLIKTSVSLPLAHLNDCSGRKDASPICTTI